MLKVLLTAPMEMRIEQVRARHKLNEVAARRYVEEVDKARTRRLQGMFGTDWRDASRYDLVVNLGYMSVSTAKQIDRRSGPRAGLSNDPGFQAGV